MARKPDPAAGNLFTPRSNWVAPSEFPSLKGVKRISLDVETCDPLLRDLGPGTIRGDAHICGVCLGIDGGARYYFPTRHEGGGNLDERMVWNWAKEELNAFDGIVVGAKLIYDLDHLWNYGVTLPNVRRFHDVQLAEPLIDETKFEYNLDSLAEEYLGENKREDKLKEAAAAMGFGSNVKANIFRMPASMVGEYGEADADLPLRIMDLQLKKLEELQILDLFDLESRLLPILLTMRRRGVRMDMDNANLVKAKLTKERDVLLAKLKHLCGPKAEFMAPDSFAEKLVDEGLPVGRTAKSGQYSITKDWLTKNAGHPIIDTVLAGRAVNTIITTFIDGHVFNHTINGRIHCEFVQLKDGDGGTGARFSSRNPNLQNIPSRDDYLAPLVRGLFLPEEDEDWECQDQSQMEYRFNVHFARGRGAQEARDKYNDDPETDFHKMCAEMMGVDTSDPLVRKKVKQINFAKTYGAQAPRLAVGMGVSIDEAKKFIAEYEAALPFTVDTFNMAKKRAGDRGYVRSILGRYANFNLWEPENNSRKPKSQREKAQPHDKALFYWGPRIVRAGTYKALNNVLQFSNADYTKKTMVDIYEAGLCAPSALGPFLLQVHDELDYSVPRTKEGNEAAAEAMRLMETSIKLSVPVVVKAKRGPTWGACE